MFRIDKIYIYIYEEQNWEPTELLKIPFACFYYLIGPLDCKLAKIDVIMQAFDTNSKKLAVHIIQ